MRLLLANKLKDRFYILSGILRCSECGSPLVGQAAHGRKQIHRYYGHTRANSATDCQFHRIPAQDVETAVLDYVWSAVDDGGYLSKVETNIRQMRNVKSLNVARDKRSAKEQLKNVQIRIDNLLLMQGQASSTEMLKQVMKTFEALTKEKVELEELLSRLDSGADREEVIRESVQAISDRLREFQRGFRKAKGSMQKRLLKKLLKQVVLTPQGLHIFMQLADGVEIPNHQIKLVHFKGSKDQETPSIAITKRASGDDSNLLVLGSDNGKFGDGYATLSAQAVLSVSLFYAIGWKRAIDYTALARKRWVDKLSMEVIAADLGMGRTAVIRHLGIIRRNPDLIEDGKVRSMIKSRKYRFMGSV